ncbi:MAG TPA: hypothetical protein VK569_06425, partial [Bacteroidota bacterium]|nr:hypothetical protein [Bacteroidota bacterium]
HGFWCARERTLTVPEWTLLGGLAVRVEESARAGEERSPVDLFSYDFPETVHEGITEFLRYAYYHGILPDVPDLRFFGSEDADDGDLPSVSPN